MRGSRRRGCALAASLAALVMGSPAPRAAAASAAPADGRSVMAEADRRARTEGAYSEGYVTVEEKGKVRRKAWRSWRAGWGPSARTLVQFLEPAEVRGVSLLTVGRPGGAGEQWFYAPAVDRDRRIARQEKSTRFIGTHFTYEDMEERDLDGYDYTLLGSEPVDGAPCFKVEARPKPEKESQYSKLLFWVLEGRFVTVRVEGFVGDEPRRTFVGSDLREVDGVLSPHRWEVVDSKREGRTVLELRNLRYRVRVDPSILTIPGMKVLQAAPSG